MEVTSPAGAAVLAEPLESTVDVEVMPSMELMNKVYVAAGALVVTPLLSVKVLKETEVVLCASTGVLTPSEVIGEKLEPLTLPVLV